MEVERAHGGYWWPLGLLNVGAALAGLAGAPLALALGTVAGGRRRRRCGGGDLG